MSSSTIEKESRILLLDDKQINQKLNRLAWQIYEDNSVEKEIILAGIVSNGFNLAQKLAELLSNISNIKVHLAEVHIDKHGPVDGHISISIEQKDLSGKSILLVDDVLNSGKTMLYSLKPFLMADVKKIRTVVLIDRNHKRFPIAADFAGLSLATTLKEHVSVEFESTQTKAWLL